MCFADVRDKYMNVEFPFSKVEGRTLFQVPKVCGSMRKLLGRERLKFVLELNRAGPCEVLQGNLSAAGALPDIPSDRVTKYQEGDISLRRYAKRWAMADRLIGLEQYRLKIEECVAMAKASASNKARANHYAQAQHYLRLFEEGSKLDSDPKNCR